MNAEKLKAMQASIRIGGKVNIINYSCHVHHASYCYAIFFIQCAFNTLGSWSLA